MVRRATITLHGAAVRLELDDGRTVCVRHKDLIGLDPSADDGAGVAADPPRIGAVDLCGGDDLAVTFTDGVTETLAITPLVQPADPRHIDLILEGAGVVATCDGAGPADRALGIVRDATVCFGGGRVRWVGRSEDLPARSLDARGAHRVDVGGRLVTPGLVDPHAHPLFAGDRADEFALRAAGRSYQDIAAEGGGIAATVRPTRATSREHHVRLTRARMARALAHGTTTCEAKSGYGLTCGAELRLLEAAAIIDAIAPVDLVPTLLGAHVVPPERRDDRAGYVDEVAAQMVPQVAARGLARSVDVYCDEGAFTVDETRTILDAARAAGLGVRAHVGQFADLGGAQLLGELGALSADHLEHVSPDGIAALAAAGVVAVMLPGACLQLRMQPPPIDALRAAGVPLALGTDLNPGSSHTESLPTQMWLATTFYRMTVPEAWLGVTRHAARALGRDDIGVLRPGAVGDAVVWEAERLAEIPSHYGVSLVHAVIKAGHVV